MKNKLLKEFISYILEARKIPVNKPSADKSRTPKPSNKSKTPQDQAKEAGYTAIATTGYWSKSGKPPAEATTRGNKFRVLTPQEREKANKELSGDTSTPSDFGPDVVQVKGPERYRGKKQQEKPEPLTPADITSSVGDSEPSGIPSSVGTSTGGIFSRIKDKLGDMIKKLVDLRQRGEGGAGGGPASQGESLFTQFGNLLRQNGGVSGLLSKVNDSLTQSFSARPEKLSREDKKLVKIRESIAQDFGWDGYDDTNPEHRTKIARYMALREQYTKDELDKAIAACESGEEHVFCKGGKEGFGQSESAYRQWLEAAFDGSVRLDNHIRSGTTRLDPKVEWTILQSTTSKEARQEGYSPDSLILTELEKARDTATSDEDRAHYEYQIKLFDKLGYHDTFAVGTDRQGRLAIVHISNKKSSDLDDPHRNSTPQEKLEELREKYRNDPELAAAAEEMVGVLDGQLEVVRDIKIGSVKTAAKLEVTDDMVTLVESPFMAPYMERVDELAKSTRKGSFGAWLKQNGHDWDGVETRDKIQLMQTYMKQNPENTYSSFGYFFVKMGEYASTKKIMRSVFGSDTVEGLEGVESLKRTEADAVGETYQVVVKKLRELDAKEGHTSTTTNGRHVQTYVDSVLTALHFDTYIDNYDQDMVLSIGRHAVTPAEIRETLMEVMPEAADIDIETSEGKAALKKYLREKARVDASTGSLILSTPNGDCVIGEDVWRTAGKTPKVASGLGSCFRQKLRKRTSKKPVDFLQ